MDRREAHSKPSEAEVRWICQRLEQTYGSPRHGNPVRPLDVLAYILLSNRTGPSIAGRIYRQLRGFIGSDWSAVREAAKPQLTNILRAGGLADKRASQLIGIGNALRADFGSVTLAPLEAWDDVQAEAYLCDLPGVSRKVAKCVLMYGFERDVLPVDVHVWRITRRLRWHDRKRSDQAQEEVEPLVPPHLRYGFHVNCVAHGRAICRPSRPDCEKCVLQPRCSFARASLPMSAPHASDDSGTVEATDTPRRRRTA